MVILGRFRPTCGTLQAHKLIFLQQMHHAVALARRLLVSLAFLLELSIRAKRDGTP